MSFFGNLVDGMKNSMGRDKELQDKLRELEKQKKQFEESEALKKAKDSFGKAKVQIACSSSSLISSCWCWCWLLISTLPPSLPRCSPLKLVYWGHGKGELVAFGLLGFHLSLSLVSCRLMLRKPLRDSARGLRMFFSLSMNLILPRRPRRRFTPIHASHLVRATLTWLVSFVWQIDNLAKESKKFSENVSQKGKEYTEKVEESNPYLKAFSSGIKGASEDILEGTKNHARLYGGFRPAEERRIEKERRLKLYHDAMKKKEAEAQAVTEEDPKSALLFLGAVIEQSLKYSIFFSFVCSAGSGIILHKDSAWRQSWDNFRENNPFMQRTFGLLPVKC